MKRSLITAVALLSIVSAPAFAATAASTPVKPAQTMTQAAPAKPAVKHVASGHSLKVHRIAKTALGHKTAPKASVKSGPAKSAG